MTSKSIILRDSAVSILRETPLSLADAAKHVPPFRKGRPVSVSCLMRWIQKGVRTPAGVVRLEACRCGGRWITSLEALERFIAAQTPDLGQSIQLPRTPAARRRASEQAAQALERLGI